MYSPLSPLKDITHTFIACVFSPSDLSPPHLIFENTGRNGQLLELFVLLCSVEHFHYIISKSGSASAYAESKGGSVRTDSVPTRFSRLIIVLQMLTYFLVPALYIFSIVNNRLQQPPWMNAFALPEVMSGVRVELMWKNAVRVFACVASVTLQRLSNNIFTHLGDQFHPIGRREKPRVVQTGPYAWVRHPLYTWILSQELLWSLMFWSYGPLFALVATGAVLAIKIPIEEEAIQRDEAIRVEYRAYMQKVPAKLVPHVW